MTTRPATQKLKDHSTELRDELLSKRPATALPWKLYYRGAGGWQFLHKQFGYLDARSSGMTKEGAHEILRSLNLHPQLVEALRQVAAGKPYAKRSADLLRELGELE